MVHYPPESKDEERKDIRNPAVSIYGKRLHVDQTLYEYTLEFLLIFASAKDGSGDGKLMFHAQSPACYYVEPRNGLRRFIFYEHARKAVRVEGDERAYHQIQDIMRNHIDADSVDDKNAFIASVQDLFRGYSAVLKKRSWCAQSLLPLCPELIFCEEMPVKKKSLKEPEIGEGSYDAAATFFDTRFDTDRHNFFARGGEVYYLHLLQALEDDEEAKRDLEQKLTDLLTAKSHQFSQLASWIQQIWVEDARIDPNKLQKKMNMGYIPDKAYREDGRLAVQELRCFLSNELHPVKRIELLTQGIMLQILRMLSDRTCEYTNRERFAWIVDMRGSKRDATIRQLSEQSYHKLNESFVDALNRRITEAKQNGKDSTYRDFLNGRKETVDLFRARGKDIKLIIPARGAHERFSLSEDVARFLVLSLIGPGEKKDLDTFLDELFRHYRMVIGPAEYLKASASDGMPAALADSFNQNRMAFQEFLKSIGCLRALSDATSIVINPYQEVVLSEIRR